MRTKDGSFDASYDAKTRVIEHVSETVDRGRVFAAKVSIED